MDLMDGLRKMFGMGAGQRIPMRTRQLEMQEEQIVNPQLRQAPIQPAPIPATGAGQVYDAAEAERLERERLLQMELQRLRGG